MTKDDIIRMARECWPSDRRMWSVDADLPRLERFANLVAAAERERIKAANAPEIEKVNAHIKALEDAVAAEREAFAKIVDEFCYGSTKILVEKAIRARNIQPYPEKDN